MAALPCSSYLYVEACTDMKQENWLMCHVHAYEYFGGVTRVLVPDNLKTFFDNGRYAYQPCDFCVIFFYKTMWKTDRKMSDMTQKQHPQATSFWNRKVKTPISRGFRKKRY
ncbi:MAG: transposase [Ruminococcus sp.]|nr:transposase [Ruminococcus sp.]